jgi:hypothetical protein
LTVVGEFQGCSEVARSARTSPYPPVLCPGSPSQEMGLLHLNLHGPRAHPPPSPQSLAGEQKWHLQNPQNMGLRPDSKLLLTWIQTLVQCFTSCMALDNLLKLSQFPHL